MSPSAVAIPAVSARLILVGGGARSGKSRFALARAGELGARRIFVATAEALDGEMATRIRIHRQERDSTFTTIEEPVALPQLLGALDGADVVLVDCLTLWVSNLMMRGATDAALAAAFADLTAALTRRRLHTILVTNEVGMGLVPETSLGRGFRDAVGALHQRLTAIADEIYAAVMGVVLRVHPAPVAMVFPVRSGLGSGPVS